LYSKGIYMSVVINGTTGITNDGGYTGDGVVFADTTPANTLVTTTGGNVGIGTASPSTFTGYTTVSVNNATNGGIYNILVNGTETARLQAYSGIFNVAAKGASTVLTFETNGSERARIDSSGNLLVGKTGTSVSGVGIINSVTGRVQISNAASTAVDDGLQIYSTGAAAYRFFVTMGGVIYATSTSITAISDVSLKENIRDLDTGLTQVMALKPRRFDWKAETQLEEKNVAGFIAQELEEVLPELVYEYKYSNNETKKSIKMGDILPTLVKAIQEQQAIILAQSAALTALTARVEALDARLISLEGTQP
jgi:hypothetical protein